MEYTLKVVGQSTVGGVKYTTNFTFILDELAMMKLAANDAKVQTRSGGDKYITGAGQNGNVIVKFTGTQRPNTDNTDGIDIDKKYVDELAVKRAELETKLRKKAADEGVTYEEMLDRFLDS